MSEELELSIVMPCLNEAETLAACITKAKAFLAEERISGEVIVADNGSTDGSREIAAQLGARVVPVAARGYGAALSGGISAARGRYVVMGDADDSYDFGAIGPFVEFLRAGNDLVMGDRFRGGIRPGAMRPLHRYLGNPALSFLGRLLFRSGIRDFHCGLRGFTREAALRMDLRTTGMEFASEMVVKATLHRMRIAEVPVVLHRDGRSRPPHLRSWRDGWRHLRFLLLYSPRWLFLYPGLMLFAAGFVGTVILLPGPRTVGGVTFDIHTLVYAIGAILAGAQAVAFALFTKVFAMGEGLLPRDERLDRFLGRVGLETGLLVGALLVGAGIAGATYAVGIWGASAFGEMTDLGRTLRIAAVSMGALALGSQVVVSSFFLSILGLRRR